MMNTATHTVSNSAQMAVYLSQGNQGTPEVICTGIDPNAKHYYMNANGGPAVNAIQQAKGRYIGTRFTDGSAVARSGHMDSKAIVEFLGYFQGEKA